MTDPTSRYAACETASLTVTGPDGDSRTLRYLRRRFVPPAEGMQLVVEHAFTQADRLDTVTAQYVGDPAQFWRICDANQAMQPAELEVVGRTLKIAMPGV